MVLLKVPCQMLIKCFTLDTRAIGSSLQTVCWTCKNMLQGTVVKRLYSWKQESAYA